MCTKGASSASSRSSRRTARTAPSATTLIAPCACRRFTPRYDIPHVLQTPASKISPNINPPGRAVRITRLVASTMSSPSPPLNFRPALVTESIRVRHHSLDWSTRREAARGHDWHHTGLARIQHSACAPARLLLGPRRGMGARRRCPKQPCFRLRAGYAASST